MSGPVALLWLALLCPPILGGDHAAAPGIDAAPAATLPGDLGPAASPRWDRPAHRPGTDHPCREIDHSIPANETETEEETGGEGPEGLSPLATIPVDPADARSRLADRRADPGGRPRRPVTRLRC